jgi:leader peptidase (prepilin peptidase)/N-methyltransferase
MNLFLRKSLESAFGVPDYFGFIFSFIIGSVIGSFLNVVIHRVPNEESIVFPNSACPKCGNPISPYDNIPILSWLVLSGKCRNCRAPISVRYPAVESLTAILFVIVYWQIGVSAYLPVALIFVAAIVALIFIDAEHMILPNVITYPLFIAALAVRIVFALFLGTSYFSDVQSWPLTLLAGWPQWAVSIMGAVLGAIAGGGFLWLIGEGWKRFRGVEAMGLGDVKMMAGVGALLGWRLTLLSIFLGAFSGALIGSFLVMRQKDRDFQMQIPFGIFLGIGSIIAMLFGDRLINWYVATMIQ